MTTDGVLSPGVTAPTGNAGVVLTALRTSGPQSRAGLARLTGLSKPTISAAAVELVAAGWVHAVGGVADYEGPGRRGQLYAFNPQIGFVVGIDIGSTSVVALLSDITGTVLASGRRQLDESTALGPLLGCVRDVVADVITSSGADAARVLGITVGVVRAASGIGTPPGMAHSPRVETETLPELIAALFPVPVTFESDMHLSLLAEQWRGAARGRRNVLYVNLDRRVDAAMLIDGIVPRGSDGGAGGLGNMPIGPDDPARGTRGRFEWAVGGDGIAYRGERTLTGGAPLGARSVFDACRDGNPQAIAIVDDAVSTLASGMKTVAAMLDPEIVVLSGRMTRAADQILPRLATHLRGELPVVVSDLRDEAVALGGVRLALSRLQESWRADPVLTTP